MLSFICLLLFIILVYVPGSTLNVIENSSESLVSNNFDKTTFIRTTTPPLPTFFTSLPSDLSKINFTTIDSIKFHQTKPSFTYNYQQSSHDINLYHNYSNLDEKTTQHNKSITGGSADSKDVSITFLTKNKHNNTRVKQPKNLPVFLKNSPQLVQDKIGTAILMSSVSTSPLSFLPTTRPTTSQTKSLFTLILPIPIVKPKHPLLVNSYPTTLEYMTSTSPNDFKASFSNNRGGRSSTVTKFPHVIPTTTKIINTITTPIKTTETKKATPSTPMRTTTDKITKNYFYESSLASPIEPTMSSPSKLLEDGYINITSQVGTHAYLPCHVKQLVKKPVSWIRIRDGHILTVDQTTFIADQRFQSIYTQNTERWSLQIKYVQIKDAGAYECQVSTEPKTSSLVRLHIVEPKTEMIGEMNRHVKAGSRVIIRCIINEALEPPIFVNWFFNDKQIYLVNQNDWRTEIVSENHTAIASLIIPSVRKKDSGNYTCNPSNSESITAVLNVLSGEYSASAITSGGSSSKQKQININRIQQQIIIVIPFICFQLQALIEIALF